MDKSTRYYYEFLGLEPGATENDVMQAYKKKAKLYHPDYNTSKNAQEIMKELNLARDELLNHIRGEGTHLNQISYTTEWKSDDEYSDDTKEDQVEDDSYYHEWQYGDNNSFNLWLNRGRCTENVWIWGIIPFLIPYAYYKVGKGWKGLGILIASPIVTILSAVLIGIGAIGFSILVYGLYDTYNLAKEYNTVYEVAYEESQ